MVNDWASTSFAFIFWMIAESFVMVTVPSCISCVFVEIHSFVIAFASGWGATTHLPFMAGVSAAVVRVIDSPGFSHVFVGGARRVMRMCVRSMISGGGLV